MLNHVPLPHPMSRRARLPAAILGPACRGSRQLPRGHTPDGASAHRSPGGVQPQGEGCEGREGVLRPLHDVFGHGRSLGVRDEGRRPDFGAVGVLHFMSVRVAVASFLLFEDVLDTCVSMHCFLSVLLLCRRLRVDLQSLIYWFSLTPFWGFGCAFSLVFGYQACFTLLYVHVFKDERRVLRFLLRNKF